MQRKEQKINKVERGSFMKTFWTIFVSVVLSLAITVTVGYFVFYKNFYVSDKNNLNRKIDNLTS